MTDMIVRMIQNFKSPMAEALPEFIIAIATKRMKLAQVDLDSIKSELEKTSDTKYLLDILLAGKVE